MLCIPSPPPFPHLMPEVKALEEKRDAIVIENEEAVTNYYRIRQQLDRLAREMQVSCQTAGTDYF